MTYLRIPLIRSTLVHPSKKLFEYKISILSKRYISCTPIINNLITEKTSNGQRTPLQEYERQVKIGKLRDDPFQRGIIKSMNYLYDSLVTYNPPDAGAIKLPRPMLTFKEKLMKRLRSAKDIDSSDVSKIGNSLPQGIYLYGDVGCGKTMLMDMFYSTIPSHLSKSRIHFHQFMQYVHKRSHEILKERKQLTDNSNEEIDTVPFLAKEIAMKSRILCFDEFQVTDVADAMILRRLLTTIMSDKYGVILFATSNRKPDDLYVNGVQRESFLPCIELIKNRTKLIFLNSETDYRKIPKPISSVYYYTTNGLKYHSRECEIIRESHVNEWYTYFAQSRHTEDSLNSDKIVHKEFTNFTLTIWGRQFLVPKCTPPSVAQFTFKQLCGEPLAAGDYLTLAKTFKSFIITDIPYLSIFVRDEVRRFITFLDAVYDNGGKIATTGAADFTSLFVEPEEILNDYQLKPKTVENEQENTGESAGNNELVTKHGFSKEIAKKSQMFALDEERFAFARALSRLSQMSTTDWVTK